MTDTALDRVPPAATAPAPRPDRVGQATAVEQSRAMAEVQAAVIVAQQNPRNKQLAIAEMRESCRQMRLAERAFFRFSRGGSTVSGPTVHLARELARVWGNVQYGISELSRDDDHGQSEMQSWAWDLQTNTRSSQVFIVPHKRDKRGGPVRLTDMRDIYEENTNQGARRLRQAIWSVLPPWFVEEAQELCDQTLREGGGKPLALRINEAGAAFAGLGVTVDRIERKFGRKSSDWTDHDVAQLSVSFKSVQRGEITLDEEFPPERITAADITGNGAAPKAAAEEPEPEGRSASADTYKAGAHERQDALAGDGWPEVKGPGSKGAET